MQSTGGEPVAALAQQLRCGGPAARAVPEVETTATALTDLLQAPAARLCPAASAAASAAALTLLGGLQAARLQLGDCEGLEKDTADGVLAARLDSCIRGLLDVLQCGLAPPTPAPAASPAPAPADVAANAAGSGSSRRQELARLVAGLGFSTGDWQAAQAGLERRTAVALSALPAALHPGLTTASTTAEPAANGSSSSGASSLSSLLAAALDTPAFGKGSGQPSALHDAVGQLLWALRQFPPPPPGKPANGAVQQQQQHALQLSAEGWAAYWMLEPQALQQSLAEILQAATVQPQQQKGPAAAAAAGVGGMAEAAGSDLQQLLQQRPQWAATMATAAQRPELHLLIRSTLHGWLEASGHPAIWRLLLLYLQAALRSPEQGGRQAGQQASLQHGDRSGQCQLPAQVRALYPAGLAQAAALLHCEQPSVAGVARAVAELRAFLQGGSGSPAAAAGGAAAGGAAALLPQQQAELADGGGGCGGTAWQRQQAWRLQLDAPAWSLFCLRRLPLKRLLELAAASGDSRETAGGDAAAAAGRDAGAAAAAGDLAGAGEEGSCQEGAAELASYLALLMWPDEPSRQAVLVDALLLRLEEVNLPAVRPWVEMLASWEGMLGAWVA